MLCRLNSIVIFVGGAFALDMSILVILNRCRSKLILQSLQFIHQLSLLAISGRKKMNTTVPMAIYLL